MKKNIFLIVLCLFAIVPLFAGPVDRSTAMALGKKFVQANFAQRYRSPAMELAYTVKTAAGEPCIYVFNVSDSGFILVSANDCTHPILGYSENNAFDINNVAPGLRYMMNEYRRAMSFAIENELGTNAAIAVEWAALEHNGSMKSAATNNVDPLCATQWDQNDPYNYYCPIDTGPGGHAYAGCVACAMAQIMKYWQYPARGTGSHSYVPQYYPTQTANFGESVYSWGDMPNFLDPNSPQTQIQAVATLMYHCGISVEMEYGPDGSGAYSEDVPDALHDYFGYAQSTLLYKSEYTEQAWKDILKDALDMGHPVYYEGADTAEEAGHAFICDGYDDNDLFHFNWGWGGYYNGYYATDALILEDISFNDYQAAIVDIVPGETSGGAIAVDYSLDGFCDEDGNILDVIALSAGDGLRPCVVLTNHGPDVPDATDTVFLDIAVDGMFLGSLFLSGADLASVPAGTSVPVPLSEDLWMADEMDQSGLEDFEFCYTIRIVGVAADPVSDNNEACINVTRGNGDDGGSDVVTVDYSLDGFCDEDGNILDVIALSAGDGLRPCVVLTNHGPDVPDATDTVFLDIAVDGMFLGSLFLSGADLASVPAGTSVPVPLSEDLWTADEMDQSGLEDFEFCYTIRIVGVAADPVSDNNEACINVTRGSDGCDSPTGLVTAADISLYPNPTSGHINVKFSSNVKVRKLQVYDIYGKLLQTVVADGNPVFLDMSGLAQGVYFVRAITEKGIMDKAFIKK